MPPSSNASRFSSLKVFKLTSSSSSPSLVASPSEVDRMPPPPPPKDIGYSVNKKAHKSPPPGNDSVPNTPISITTQFASYSSLISTGDPSQRPSTSSRTAQDISPTAYSQQTNHLAASSATPYARSNVSLNVVHPSASAVSLVSQVSSSNQYDTIRPGEAAQRKVKAVAGASAFLRGIMGKRAPSPNPSVAASSSGENEGGGAYLNPNWNPPSSSAQSIRSLRSMKSMGAMKGEAKNKLKGLLGGGRSSGRDRSGSEASNGTGVYESDGDDAISMPWNFQHNIHVDEGLSGLPPSWSTQLRGAGFTDEEIAIIVERRKQQQQQVSAYLSNSPSQPNPPTPITPVTSSTGTVLIQPVPRSTSLRNASNGSGNTAHSRLGSAVTNASTTSLGTSTSSRSRGTSIDDHSAPSHQYTSNYPLPPINPLPPRPPLLHSASNPSTRDARSLSPSMPLPDLPTPQPLNVSAHSSPSSPYPPLSSHLPPIPVATPPSDLPPPVPTTPPRRTTPGLYVVNGIGSPVSPPPAYAPTIQGAGYGFGVDKKEREEKPLQEAPAHIRRRESARNTIVAPKKPSDVSSVHSGYSADNDAPSESGLASVERSPNPDNEENDHFFDNSVSILSEVSVTPQSRGKRRSKRFSLLPPRLSLTLKHEEGGDDLSLWSEAIISAIPSTADEEEFGRKALMRGLNTPGPSSGKPLGSATSSGTMGSAGTRTIRSGSSASVYSDERTDDAQTSTSRWQREQERVLRQRTDFPPPIQPLSPVKKTSSMIPSALSASSNSSSSTTSSPSTSKPSPIPTISPGSFVSPGDPTRSVLFDEIMSAVNPTGRSPSSGRTNAFDEPALTEKFSPTLPVSPENARQNAIKFQVNMYGEDLSNDRLSSGGPSNMLTVPEEEDGSDALDNNRLSSLTVGNDSYEDRRDANRDSSMSTISTVTVTNATIVRSASYATRAVANVEVIAPRSESPSSTTQSNRSRSASPMTGPSDQASTSGAGKRGELSIGPAALITGDTPSPAEASPGVLDAYGGLAPSPPDSSGAPARMNPPLTSVAERMVGMNGRQPTHKSSSSSASATLQIASSDNRQYPASPQSSHFSSEESSWSGTGSSSSISRDQPTPTTEAETEPTISGHFKSSSYSDKLFSQSMQDSGIRLARSLSSAKLGKNISPTSNSSSPLSPFQRYRGWQHEVVKPLEEFIDDAVDPREYYLDQQEIAEGESGSVYSARLVPSEKIHKLKLPPLTKARDAEDLGNGRQTLVAIKNVPILPSGSPKLVDLRRELKLLKGLWHTNVLGMDAVYVDLVEDSLWIRMELMERSLADVVAIVAEGLMLQERMMARFASDILLALDYLRKHRIAHRDLRSDNLLLNNYGILKLADFSSAIQVSPDHPECSEVVGVPYWQAPEMRSGPYDPLKVDIWSLGATVWEMAQAEPPFSADQKLGLRWPPLSQPDLFSPSFHDFLRLCSDPVATRPDAADLMKKSFVQNACGRPVIIQLLSQCTAIEAKLQADDDS